MFVIVRDHRHTGQGEDPFFLSYDIAGKIDWTENRLEAARFSTEKEARECMRSLTRQFHAHVRRVGADGHTILYRNHEVQIYIKGGSWKVRTRKSGDVSHYGYHYGRKPQPSARKALAYGRALIDSLPTTFN